MLTVVLIIAVWPALIWIAAGGRQGIQWKELKGLFEKETTP